MKFTIPINNLKEKVAYAEYYDYLNLKKIKKSYLYIALGVVYILLGLFTLDNIVIKTIMVVLGSMVIYSYISHIISIKRQKKKLLNEIDRQYKLSKDSNALEYTLEFNEDFFIIEHKLNSSKTAWSLFYSYQVIDDKLILRLSEDFTLIHLYRKEVFSNDDFEKIISFIRTKVKGYY